MTIPRLCGCYS